jgi:broad specificity phosphatase PhoE
MVRILFIRHGMTVENLMSAQMAIRVAKKLVKPENSQAQIREQRIALGGGEAEADTNLSDYKGGGLKEAQMLADYWGPLLKGKKEANELHIFVSPMVRCLQTANPIMNHLKSEATITPIIMEIPGLCNPSDRLFLDEQVRPLFDQGKEKKMRQILNQRTWKRCGYTKQEMKAQFPWIRKFDFSYLEALDEVLKNNNNNDIKWWKGCWEATHESNTRMKKAKEWLFTLADTLPEDDVVVLFSHGDTIWRLLSSIVGIDSNNIEHATANTSISSVKVNPASTDREGKITREIQLDFYNRTPHLKDRNLDFYKFNGLINRREKGKKPLVDLSDEMRSHRISSKDFMSKL